MEQLCFTTVEEKFKLEAMVECYDLRDGNTKVKLSWRVFSWSTGSDW
jgi:hypothetical protein